MKPNLLQYLSVYFVSILLSVLPGSARSVGKAFFHANTIYTSTYNSVSYSSDHPYNLNVVYFLPSDVPLDSSYRKRLSALLLYGQNFYKQQMINNGYGAKTFGLFTETANPDSVKLILIHAAHPKAYYENDNHGPIEQQVNDTFATHPSYKTSEHTLIITACPSSTDTHVPFYGIGKTCFALDYPDQDIKYLGDTGPHGSELSVWYGGMMHELGHGLNLPHSHQTNTENADPAKGMNLMWAGNGTLGISPTFINRAGCAILNNCQVFADAPGNVFYDGHTAGLTKLKAVFDNGDLVISGKFQSNKTVKDINIYQDPYASPSPGYYRVAWSVSPVADSFYVRMPVSEIQTTSGPYNLQIELVLENGEITFDSYAFSYNNGVPVTDFDFDYNAPCDVLPAQWTLADIGTTGTPGTACYTASNERYRINSYGTGVGDPSDNFTYVYTTLAGDGIIMAKVRDVSATYNFSGGIMLRNTLAANSSFVYLNALDTRGVFDLWRSTDGGNVNYKPVTTFPVPMWLKLVRKGNNITSFYSADSLTWLLYNSYTLALNNTVYVGMAASGNSAVTNIDHVHVGPIPPFICNGGSATGCPAFDTIPGMAAKLEGSGYIDIPSLNTNPSNTFTITGWIKPNGIQANNAPWYGYGNGNIRVGSNNDNELGYTWEDQAETTNWHSGLFVPANTWSFVAMVIYPDSAVFYLNSKKATQVTAMNASPVYHAQLGIADWYYNTAFNGNIDEVSMWHRSLSAHEIDSLRHLTREKIANNFLPDYDPSMFAYFQFNDSNSRYSYNLIDSSIISFTGSASKIKSTAPVGSGISAKATIAGAGNYVLDNTGIALNFPATGTYPGGDVWVSKINQQPNIIPTGATTGNAYWILNNYGTNDTFTAHPSIQVADALNIPVADASTPQNYKLYQRPATADTKWGVPTASANLVTAGSPGSVSIANTDISTEAQILIAKKEALIATADSIAGKMLDLTPAGNPVITLAPVPINSNTFTITLWAKPKGLQKVFSQIISSQAPNSRFGIGFAFPGYNDNTNLVFTGDVINYGQQSNINLVPDAWNYVALTYSPAGVKIYLNGGNPWEFTSSTTGGFNKIDFSKAPVSINADIHSQNGNYKGQVDEVCFYDYVLTQEEIRRKMNLTKNPDIEEGLVGYYQFNQYNTATHVLNDAMGAGASSTVSNSNITSSTLPVGSGTSFSIPNVATAGTYNFTGTGASITFPGPVVPNGEVMITRLNSQPDSIPAGYSHTSSSYWIIHNWGTNTAFDAPTAMQFSNLQVSADDAATPSVLKLLKRSTNEYMNNWENPLCSASSATAGDNGLVTFDNSCNNTSFSQFLIATTGSSILPVSLLSFTGTRQQENVMLQWKVSNEVNMSYYQPERSTDGLTFKPVGIIKATGSSIYSLADAPLLNGVIYYRLKMVNADGSFSYSNVVTLTSNANNFISFSPNPVMHNRRLTITNNSTATADVYFYTADGKLLRHLVIAPLGIAYVSNLPIGTIMYKATTTNGNTISGIEIVQ